MQIRFATTADADQLKSLYYHTILTVNANNYSKEQVEVWASTAERTAGLLRRIREQYFYVVYNDDGIITGFASVDETGYLDMLYVHKDYQRMGIASLLLEKILDKASELGLKLLTTEASITARPFFEKNHFTVLKEQLVYINAVPLTNYYMQRIL